MNRRNITNSRLILAEQKRLIKYANLSNYFLVIENKNISLSSKKLLIREFINLVEEKEAEEEIKAAIDGQESEDGEGGFLDSVLDSGKEGLGDYAIVAIVQFLLTSMGVPKDSFLGTLFANSVKNFAKRGFDFADVYEMFNKGEYSKIADIILIDLEDAIVQRIVEAMIGEPGLEFGGGKAISGVITEMIKNGIRESGIAIKIREMIINYLKDFKIGDVGSMLKSAAGGAMGSIMSLFS